MYQCENLVNYNAQSGYGYISVDEKCGNTDAYGNTLICEKCRHDESAKDHRANAKADQESYSNAGYGQL